jgi:hypothetical protein
MRALNGVPEVSRFAHGWLGEKAALNGARCVNVGNFPAISNHGAEGSYWPTPSVAGIRLAGQLSRGKLTCWPIRHHGRT